MHKVSDKSKCRLLVIAFAIATILLFLFGSCRTIRESEKTERQDSVIVEEREKIVYVPVTTYVEVPAQSAERETRDSTSHLETGFAISDAAIRWVDGVPFLHHSLANKPQRIENTDSVPVRERQKVIREKSYNTVFRTKVLKKRLTLYQKAMVYLAPWLLTGMLLYIIYIRMRLQRKQ